jgi:hypothetical protein
MRAEQALRKRGRVLPKPDPPPYNERGRHDSRKPAGESGYRPIPAAARAASAALPAVLLSGIRRVLAPFHHFLE